MARKPLRPLIRGGGFYPSRKWTPLVYAGGYTTANGGEEPAPPPIEKTITGNPIHILDALARPAQALSVKLEHVQDLNGYSYPWPAGGGKNLLNPDTVTKTSTIDYANGIWTMNPFNTSAQIITVPFASHIGDSVTVSFTAWASDTTTARFDGQPDSVCTSGTDFSDKTVNLTTNKNRFSYSGTILDGTTGFRIFRTSSIVGAQTVSIYIENIQIELGSTATDYAPYSNICPISGWTGANVTRTGKNLFDPTTFSSRSNYYDVNDDGSVKIKASDSSGWKSVPIISLKAGTYTISINDYTSGNYQVETSEDNYTSPTHKRYDAAFTFTLTKDGGIKVKMGTGGATLPQTVKPMLNIGYTAASYSPYSGDTYSITFPSEAGTVYGGTLDVTTGKLTVQWGIVDLGTLRWLTHSQNFFYTAVSGKMPGTTNLICTNYKTKMRSLWAADELAISGNANTGQIYIRDMSLQGETGDEFKADMSGVQLCYELAAPITYDLTPTEVTLLLGENNIWSDGEMTLTYLADGNASDEEALNILLGGRYVNNHSEDEPTDREALNIVLGGNER